MCFMGPGSMIIFSLWSCNVFHAVKKNRQAGGWSPHCGLQQLLARNPPHFSFWNSEEVCLFQYYWTQCLSSSWFSPRTAFIVILLTPWKLSLILCFIFPWCADECEKYVLSGNVLSQALQIQHVRNRTTYLTLNVNAFFNFPIFEWLHCSHKVELFLKPHSSHIPNK